MKLAKTITDLSKPLDINATNEVSEFVQSSVADTTAAKRSGKLRAVQIAWDDLDGERGAKVWDDAAIKSAIDSGASGPDTPPNGAKSDARLSEWLWTDLRLLRVPDGRRPIIVGENSSRSQRNKNTRFRRPRSAITTENPSRRLPLTSW